MTFASPRKVAIVSLLGSRSMCRLRRNSYAIHAVNTKSTQVNTSMHANNIQNHHGTCCDHTEKSGGAKGGGALGGQITIGGYDGVGDNGSGFEGGNGSDGEESLKIFRSNAIGV